MAGGVWGVEGDAGRTHCDAGVKTVDVADADFFFPVRARRSRFEGEARAAGEMSRSVGQLCVSPTGGVGHDVLIKRSSSVMSRLGMKCSAD